MPLPIAGLIVEGITALGKGIIDLFSENMEDPDKKAELQLKATELQQQIVIRQLQSLETIKGLEVDDAKSARELAVKEAENLPEVLAEIQKLPRLFQLGAVPLAMLRVAVRPMALIAFIAWFFMAKFQGIPLGTLDYALIMSVTCFYFGSRSIEKINGIGGKA